MSDEPIPGFEFEVGLYEPPTDTARLHADFPVTIGRRSTNHLVLHHSSVSGAHAQLEVEEVDGEKIYYVRDLGSTNGTKMDGQPVTRRRIDNGDLVFFGDVGLRFGLLPEEWWDESRADYLTGALPWPLAVPFYLSRTAEDPEAKVLYIHRLCEEMTRLATAAGSAVAAANGGADSALRWALTRLREPSPHDWIGAVNAVVRAGSHRGWLEHLPGLIGSTAGTIPGTEGAWEALKQWVKTATKERDAEDFHTRQAVLQVLEPGLVALLLAWKFLHEGRMIWVERDESGWGFDVFVAHGARPATRLEGIRLMGQIPGERVPYWILSAAGGAACLAPWYKVNPDPNVPIVSWEGCPDDLTPTYRAADSGQIVSSTGDNAIPMGPAGSYQWRGYKDYLAADRSVGAVVEVQMAPDDWARILGVGGESADPQLSAELDSMELDDVESLSEAQVEVFLDDDE